MTIGIDVDNVLNNLGETVIKIYNRDSGDNLILNDVKEYHIENYVKPQYKDNFYKYFSSGEVWRKIDFIPRCKEFISKLFNDGHTIYFITKTEPRNFYKKANWLERNFPYLDIRKCFFNCPDKKLMNIDVMIDDHLDNLGGAQKYKIIFDYPYNRNIHKKDYSCFRCYNWEEIYNIIKKLNEVEVSLNGNNY